MQYVLYNVAAGFAVPVSVCSNAHISPCSLRVASNLLPANAFVFGLAHKISPSSPSLESVALVCVVVFWDTTNGLCTVYRRST